MLHTGVLLNSPLLLALCLFRLAGYLPSNSLIFLSCIVYHMGDMVLFYDKFQDDFQNSCTVLHCHVRVFLSSKPYQGLLSSVLLMTVILPGIRWLLYFTVSKFLSIFHAFVCHLSLYDLKNQGKNAKQIHRMEIVHPVSANQVKPFTSVLISACQWNHCWGHPTAHTYFTLLVFQCVGGHGNSSMVC